MVKRVVLAGGLGLLVLVLTSFLLPGSENSPVAHEARVLAWIQASETPTPGFGPVVTAAPSPTGQATATPLPTHTPAPPTATATTAPTEEPTVVTTPVPKLDGTVMGIQIDPGLSEQDFVVMLNLAKRMGVEWIKLQFAWDLMEPESGRLGTTFYTFRMFVQRADQEGFKVLASVAKAPDWSRASLEEDGPPRDPQALADFLTRMLNEVRVDLYGNSYFEAIEIWNEPNLRREWNGGTLGGAEYMRYFDAAYQGIRNGEGGHSVTVVTAGLAPTGWDDGVTAIDDRAFLRQMYEAGLNNANYQNIAIGVHPYGAWNPPDSRWCGETECSEYGYDNHPSWFFIHTLEDYHGIMTEFGDTGRQLWATEFGWGTYDGFVTSEGEAAAPPADPPYFQYVTLDQQAAYIVRAFEIGQNLPYVGPMFLWNLNYSNSDLIDAGDARAAYGLLMPGLTDPLRPAFKQIEQATH